MLLKKAPLLLHYVLPNDIMKSYFCWLPFFVPLWHCNVKLNIPRVITWSNHLYPEQKDAWPPSTPHLEIALAPSPVLPAPPVPYSFLVFPQSLFCYLLWGKLHEGFPCAPPLVVHRQCYPIWHDFQPFNPRTNNPTWGDMLKNRNILICRKDIPPNWTPKSFPMADRKGLEHTTKNKSMKL